jgi:hypothetical protein
MHIYTRRVFVKYRMYIACIYIFLCATYALYEYYNEVQIYMKVLVCTSYRWFTLLSDLPAFGWGMKYGQVR